MEKSIELFQTWKALTPDERAYFAGMCDAYNRMPKESAAAAPRQRKARKPKASAPVAQAAAAGASA